MRISARTALAATVIALAASPLAGTSHAADAADGCASAFLDNRYTAPTNTVVRNPDGSVTVNPNPPVWFAGAVAGNAVELVTCIV